MKKIILLAMFAGIFISSTASARLVGTYNNVQTVSLSDHGASICKIKLTKPLTGALASCNVKTGAWVALNCKGYWGVPKEVGFKQFAIAQQLQLTKKRVRLYIDTKRKLDQRYCVVRRIDAL